jgi:hypothetical protein
MKNIFNFFKRKNNKQQINIPNMKMLLRSVAMTENKELSCDEVFDLLDQFAEMIKNGEDAAQWLPLVQSHLDMCPDCREEYETLVQMMDNSSDIENQHN